MTDDHIPVHLSTSSVYPENAAYAFDLAGRLGYDGVEIMVWTDPVTQEAGALNALASLHRLSIGAIHAPTLLLAQRLWGWEPWGKVERALDLAGEVGADCVVVHPPFRWQRGYAENFVEGVAERQEKWGIKIAVENMFPWRSGVNSMQAYLPGPDPRDFPYGDVTLDISHAATAGTDALERLYDLLVFAVEGEVSFEQAWGFWIEVYSAAHKDENIRVPVANAMLVWRGIFEQTLDEAIEEGLIKPFHEREVLTTLLLAVVDGLALQTINGIYNHSPAKMIEILRRIAAREFGIAEAEFTSPRDHVPAPAGQH